MLFRIHSFCTFTGSCCGLLLGKMLKTWVTPENNSRVLLNLTKKNNICNVKRLLLPLNVNAVNSRILALVHQLWLLLTLTFVRLPYLFR